MRDVEIIGILKTYVQQTLVGMGALKGANCQIQSIDKTSGVSTVTFLWKDSENVEHTGEMIVLDGATGPQGPQGIQGIQGEPGTNGTDGTDGYSPTITVKENTSERYVLTITDVNGSYDTPNLKGSGGGGGASALSDLTDVQIASLANGDALIYNGPKWANVSLAAIATSGDLSDASFDNTASGLSATNGQAAINELASDLNNKVEKENGKGLSSNDFSNAYKSKLDGIESGAEVNKIDSISVNGVAQTISNKAVDLDVASNLITETQWTAIQALLV